MICKELWEFPITQDRIKSCKLAYHKKKLDEEKKNIVKDKSEKDFKRKLKMDEIQEVKKQDYFRGHH